MLSGRTIAIVTLLVGAARADDDDEVRIKGTEAGGFSSRVRLEDQPREVTDAASLIESEPGVHVRRLGGDDGFATLSIRGASSTQVAVVLAGVPLSGGGTPTVDLSTLPIWPGVSARIFRTFAPGSLGPGSLGGTLAWDPPSPHAPEKIETWAAVGSFGSLRMRSGAITKVGSMRIASGFTASRADDNFVYANDDFGLVPGATPELVRVNAGHAQVSGSIALTAPYKLAKDREGSVRIVTLLQGRDQHLPGAARFLTPFQQLRSDRELFSIEGTHPATNTVSTYAQFWGKREGLSLTDSPPPEMVRARRADQAVVAMGGAGGVRGRPLPKWRGDVRIEGRGERFIPETYIGAKNAIGTTRAAVATAADLEWRPIDPMTVAFTGRLEHYRDATGDDSDEKTIGTTHVGLEAAGKTFAAAVHGGYVSRAPSFLERFGVLGGYLPTANLRGESAWAVDGGVRASKKIGALRLSGEATGFATYANDLIVFTTQGQLRELKAENIGRAWIAGLEARAGAKWKPFELRASYTLMGTQNDSGCALGVCPPLPGRPRHDLVIDALATVGLVRFRWGLDVLAGMRADDAGTIEIPARALQSIGVKFMPWPGLEWALDVRNLFDERTATYPGFLPGETLQKPIADALGFPLPGRSVLLSVRIFTPED